MIVWCSDKFGFYLVVVRWVLMGEVMCLDKGNIEFFVGSVGNVLVRVLVGGRVIFL